MLSKYWQLFKIIFKVSISLKINVANNDFRFKQNLDMAKFNELSLFPTYNSFIFFPLISKNLINASTFGHSPKNFKTFKFGKLTCCNWSKSSNPFSYSNDKISSSKPANVAINDNGILESSICNLVNVEENLVNEEMMFSVPSILSLWKDFSVTLFKSFCKAIKSDNPSEMTSLNSIVNDCILRHIWDIW